MGNFGAKSKGGRVNHFLAVAPDMLEGPAVPGGDSNGNGSAAKVGSNYSSSAANYLQAPPVPMPSITRNQLDEHKQMVRPHPLTHRVFQCVAMLLGYRDTTWPGCRAMLASPNFIREIVLLQPMTIPYEEVNEVRDVLTELGPSFNPGNLQRQSILAADMLEWCIRVIRSHYVSTAQNSHMEYDDGSGAGRRTAETVDEEYLFADEERNGYDDADAAGYGHKEADCGVNVTYVHGQPKQPLAVRVMMMDPNPDYGGQPKAKSPITAPLHMRNDVGPQPVRRKVFQNHHGAGGNNKSGGGASGGGGSSGFGSRGTGGGKSARSSMSGWGKSRGSRGSTRNGQSSSSRRGAGNGEIRVNNW